MQVDRLLSTGNLGFRVSDHAAVRVRQRGIAPDALRCLLAYGRREHDHLGAEIISFDQKSLELMRQRESKVTWLAAEKARSLYAVLSGDGCVITTGYRFQRIQRDRSLVNKRRQRTSPLAQRALLPVPAWEATDRSISDASASADTFIEELQ